MLRGGLLGQISECLLSRGLDTKNEMAEERGKPVEDLLTIPLHNENPQHVQIGSRVDKATKQQLVSFLQKNVSVFTWSPLGILGIEPEVMMHYLNVDPTHRLVK